MATDAYNGKTEAQHRLLSAVQPCPPDAVQPCSPDAVLPYSSAAVLPCSPDTIRPCSSAAVQSCPTDADRKPSIYSLIDKAIHDYDMLQSGDRILVAASGGKDSTLMAEYLSRRMREPRSSFTLHAVTVQSDFAPPFPSQIASLFDAWQLPLQQVNADILRQVKAGHKMNCWWCSTRRRGELLRIALEGGWNKIALGHHMDDILETLLMNTLERGGFSTMLPNFAYSRYPVRVIRPLCLVTEERIKEYAASKGWAQYTCTCSYQSNSTRRKARSLLEALTEGSTHTKQMLFKAAMRSSLQDGVHKDGGIE